MVLVDIIVRVYRQTTTAAFIVWVASYFCKGSVQVDLLVKKAKNKKCDNKQCGVMHAMHQEYNK